MATELTPNLSLPLLVFNQAGKEITHNEALIIIDALLNNGVESMFVNIPPLEPEFGNAYVTGENPSGEFSNHVYEFAFFNNGWRFFKPKEGLSVWVKDEDSFYVFNGSTWLKNQCSSSLDLSSLSDVDIISMQENQILVFNGTKFVNSKVINNLFSLGVNASSDETNRFAVSSPAILFNNFENDVRVKVNKKNLEDTGSILFSTNYSGRAELGLIGNNFLTLKVSLEENKWKDAIIINNETGGLRCPNYVDVEQYVNIGNGDEAGILELQNENGVSAAKINSNGDSFLNGGGLSIGNTTLDCSAFFEIKSSSKGFLPPRLTLEQRDLISSPAEGLIVFNSTSKILQCFDGTNWQNCF